MKSSGTIDYLDAIFKGKWIIAVCLIVSLLASYIFSSRNQVKIFEAKSIFTVSPVEIESGIQKSQVEVYNVDPKGLDSTNRLGNKMLGVLLNQINYPKLSSNDMAQILNSDEYKNRVNKTSSIKITGANVNVSLDGNTNTITLTVNGSDREQVSKINKALVENLSDYLGEKITEQFKKTETQLQSISKKEMENVISLEKQMKSVIKIENGVVNPSLSGNVQVENLDLLNSYILSKQALDSLALIRKEWDGLKNKNPKEYICMNILNKDETARDITPNKKTTMAVAGVLGLMAGVTIALVMDLRRKRVIR
ncbi:MAG: hypothetical protein N2645_10515 [Clostridia bacterium]|nr:hypothetical protein [Clostridia bacterium]